MAVSYDTKTPFITQVEYRAFQVAFDFFNHRLFGGSLPQVLMTLQRRAGMRGYVACERFLARLEPGAVHELALNPNAFVGHTDREIVSTLVHEQVHVWQVTHGTPARAGYHNREWADQMQRIGLYPSATGQPGGKETGQRMRHYIVEGGPYAQAWTELETEGFRLHWESPPESTQARSKRESKTKYTCPDCGLNAWAKQGVALVCGDCETPLAAQKL